MYTKWWRKVPLLFANHQYNKEEPNQIFMQIGHYLL